MRSQDWWESIQALEKDIDDAIEQQSPGLLAKLNAMTQEEQYAYFEAMGYDEEVVVLREADVVLDRMEERLRLAWEAQQKR